MREVVFVDFARTAFGKRGGALRCFSGTELGAACLKGLVQKSGIWEKGGADAVNAVFAGSAFKDKLSSAPVRYMTQLAGFPVGTEAHQVEMQCGSAITSINHAAFQLALGYTDIAIAGGVESHSTRPVFLSSVTDPYKALAPRWITMRLAPADDQNIPMVAASDLIADIWNVSRAECDEFALRSQQRLAAAYASGLIGDEIIPVTVPGGKKAPDIIVNKDEHPRPDSTMEGLERLCAVNEGGVTTAGNASGMNDGAAFVLMMTREKAEELGYEPYARWVMGADVGVEPRLVLNAPVRSNLKALRLAGLDIMDMDVWECNEAFAAQNLSVIKEMEDQSGCKIDRAKWNPNGGAIAFGHPNGASGARIGIFAMRELERNGGRYGLFSSCCGGGHGVTTLIENLRR